MSDIVVKDNFKSYNNNKKYVIKIEDPVTRVTYLRKEVTVPTSGVYKLALNKTTNITPENSNSLSEIEGLKLPTFQGRPRSFSVYGNNLMLPKAVGRPRSPSKSGSELELPTEHRPRSPSLSGNNLGLPNAVGRPRSPSLSGNNLGLPNAVGRPRSPSLSGNNLGLPNAVGRPRSPSLSGNNLGLPKGGRKRKTRRQRK